MIGFIYTNPHIYIWKHLKSSTLESMACAYDVCLIIKACKAEIGMIRLDLNCLVGAKKWYVHAKFQAIVNE